MCVFECFGSFYNVIAEQRKQRKGVSMYWGVGQERQRVQEGKVDDRDIFKRVIERLWRGVKIRGVRIRGKQRQAFINWKQRIYIER